MRPRKKFFFLPLIPRLRRLYEIKAFSHLLSKHMDRGVANDIVRDIHDSPGWHRQFEQGGLFEGDPRHLLLQFCQDGMNPFDMRKNVYSMSPQLMKVMNLPMTAREKLGFLLLVGLITAASRSLIEAIFIPIRATIFLQAPENQNPYSERLVDELLLLLEGVWAFDGLKREAFKLKAKDIIQKVHGVMCSNDDTKAVREEESRLGRFPECREPNEEDQWEDVVEPSQEENGASSKKQRKRGKAQQKTGDKLKPGPWALTKADQKKADIRSSAVKVPVNFGWRPRPFFEKISNMKSHCWKQIFSHGIMKYCARGFMNDKQRETLNLLCDVLSALCAPCVNRSRLPDLIRDIHRCLARLERDFPVSIMTAIVHWVSHITPYISEYGPSKTYWMFLYERMNSFLSARVKNRQHPEATVVESYRIYDFVQYMALAGFLPEGAVPTTTAQQMALVEAEEDEDPGPREGKTEVSGAGQHIQLTKEQTIQLEDFHIKHTAKYQNIRKQLRAKYLHSPSKSSIPFTKWSSSSPKLSTEEREAMAGPSTHGIKYLRAVRDPGIEYRCKDAETRTGSIVSSYVAVEGQQMRSQVDVGRVNFFFKHSFLGEEVFLANVTWFPTAT
ncbi:hypothetical protein Bbelb_318660 [Branchiostoma belcheri]|nr:hypothetical protein Bbelb_318660 [Branchiostoma belcheri]